MNPTKRLLQAIPHTHQKWTWYGDRWNFETGTHTVRWLCPCGKGWVETRDFNEFPHITAGAPK